MSHDLDRSWRKLKHVERVLLDYFDTKFVPGDVVSPVLSPSNARASPKARGSSAHFGGILNNRNDPSKRKEKFASSPVSGMETKTFDFTATAARFQNSQSDFTTSPIFRTYEQEKAVASASSLLRRPRYHKSTSSGQVRNFTDLVLAPKKVNLKKKIGHRPATKVKKPASRLVKVTKGVDTDEDRGIEIVSPVTAPSVRLENPILVQRCTPASMFLDHLVREQAYRRYARRPARSIVHIPRVRSPQVSYRNSEMQCNLEDRDGVLQLIGRKSIVTEAFNAE